jgi:hypothetical protein
MLDARHCHQHCNFLRFETEKRVEFHASKENCQSELDLEKARTKTQEKKTTVTLAEAVQKKKTVVGGLKLEDKAIAMVVPKLSSGSNHSLLRNIAAWIGVAKEKKRLLEALKCRSGTLPRSRKCCGSQRIEMKKKKKGVNKNSKFFT